VKRVQSNEKISIADSNKENTKGIIKQKENKLHS
jgi:hypothetical protein